MRAKGLSEGIEKSMSERALQIATADYVRDSKKCPSCGCVKPLSDFPNRPESKDGKRGQCKVCFNVKALAKGRRWKKTHKDQERIYSKRYCQSHKLLRRINWRAWGRRNKDKIKERNRRTVERKKSSGITYDQTKARARIIVNNSVRSGKLLKPKVCSKCGVTANKIHGHHTDYSKPLEVVWLCSICHAEEHYG